MKHIIYKTRLQIKDSNDKIIIPGVRIVDNEFEITEHVKIIAENNGVHEKLITVNCYPIPDEKYDELKKFVDSNNIVMSSKDDIIFLLFKYTNPEEF
jgi:hypothetical protein